MARKRRTREHTIHDLAANHTERFALLCGFSVERIEHDYGTDLLLFTYDTTGEIENGMIFLQLKATDNLQVLQDKQMIALELEKGHLETWLTEPLPVILVVYDTSTNRAYWLYVQAYFERLTGFSIHEAGKRVTIHVPITNLVNETAIRRFRDFKQRVLSQIEGVIHHGD